MTTTSELKQQTGKVLTHVAGYVSMRTIEIGLSSGLIGELASHANGLTVPGLAERCELDPFYVRVWCRSAYAAEVLELHEATSTEGYDPQSRAFTAPAEQRYTLAAHMAAVLLDETHPDYIGGIPTVMVQREIFDAFAERLTSGERSWWDKCSPEFIDGVSGAGLPYYTRMIPGGLSRIPGLEQRLRSGAAVTELSSAAGRGLAMLAKHFPKCQLTGVHGDAYSLELASKRIADAGLGDRTTLVQSTLEDFDVIDQDVVFINISMHECRDIDKVTANVSRALRPGGVFVISDFPFPESTTDCRTVPARIMSGIQFFEALMDDQLMATSAFVNQLARHGFDDVASFDITSTHVVIHGTKRA